MSTAPARVAATLLVAGLLALATPRAAHAEHYEDVVREAIHEFTAGNFVEARTLFQRAHALKPSARTLRGLGMTSYELKHYVQALSELQAALADTRNPLTSEQRAEVNAALAKTRRYVGTVVLDVQPAGATVTIDGEPVRGRELVLDAGDHTLDADAPGHRHNQRRITVLGGARTRVALRLQPHELDPAHAARSAAGGSALDVDREGERGPNDAASGSGGGLLGQWWFWTLTGVVLAGATVATVVVLGDQNDPSVYKGSTGVALQPP